MGSNLTKMCSVYRNVLGGQVVRIKFIGFRSPRASGKEMLTLIKLYKAITGELPVIQVAPDKVEWSDGFNKEDK